MSKRNIEALGKVSFSAKVDFSIGGGLKIAEIERVENIERPQPKEVYTDELNGIFKTMCLTLLWVKLPDRNTCELEKLFKTFSRKFSSKSSFVVTY